MREYKDVFKINNIIKLIWIILIDEKSDKNFWYLKNIYQYYHLFKKLDLNYLTICTYISG